MNWIIERNSSIIFNYTWLLIRCSSCLPFASGGQFLVIPLPLEYKFLGDDSDVKILVCGYSSGGKGAGGGGSYSLS